MGFPYADEELELATYYYFALGITSDELVFFGLDFESTQSPYSSESFKFNLLTLEELELTLIS